MNMAVDAALGRGREENPVHFPAQKPTTLARRARLSRLPDDWSETHDEALRASKGRWARIEALAAKWGVETRVLTARWHRLRATKSTLDTPAGRQVVPVDFEALVQAVTPRMAVILRCIKAMGQAGYDDFSDELGGVDVLIVRRCIERNTPRIERLGWRLRRDVVDRCAMFSLVRL